MENETKMTSAAVQMLDSLYDADRANISSDEATLEEDAITSETSEEAETVETTDTDTTEEQEKTEPKETIDFDKLNKRLNDKDKYINELRSEIENLKKEFTEGKSNPQEEVRSQGEADFEFDLYSEEGEQMVKDLFKTVKQLQSENARLKNDTVLTQEQVYAQGKSDYWEVVNSDDLTNAFKTDDKFAQEFSSSNKPYEVAYNYLKANNSAKQQSFEDKIKGMTEAELERILGVKVKKEVMPNPVKVGSSNGSKVMDDSYNEDTLMSRFKR